MKDACRHFLKVTGSYILVTKRHRHNSTILYLRWKFFGWCFTAVKKKSYQTIHFACIVSAIIGFFHNSFVDGVFFTMGTHCGSS